MGIDKIISSCLDTSIHGEAQASHPSRSSYALLPYAFTHAFHPFRLHTFTQIRPKPLSTGFGTPPAHPTPRLPHLPPAVFLCGRSRRTTYDFDRPAYCVRRPGPNIVRRTPYTARRPGRTLHVARLTPSTGASRNGSLAAFTGSALRRDECDRERKKREAPQRRTDVRMYRCTDVPTAPHAKKKEPM